MRCAKTLLAIATIFAAMGLEAWYLITIPKAIILPPTANLGIFDKGRKREFDFKLINAGHRKLKVNSLVSSCGCMQCAVDKKTLPPFTAANIHVEYDGSGHSGAIRRIVRIRTNDPIHPISEISLVGTMNIAVMARPSDVYLGIIEPGVTASRTIKLIYPTTKAIKLKNIKSASYIHVMPGKRAEQIQDVFVRFSAPVGEFDEPIYFRFSDGKTLVVRITGVSSKKGEYKPSI